MRMRSHCLDLLLAVFLLLAGSLLAACGASPAGTGAPEALPATATAVATLNSPSATPSATASPVDLVSTPVFPGPAIGDDAGYASDGGGDPRTVGYWLLWNTCAEENRSDLARANGGRAAGWILMDDLLEDPGIKLGDHPVTICEEGLALLQGRTFSGEETGDPIYGLAAALLAAELNLTVGAESCPVAEEVVLGGHIVLARVGFDGSGAYAAATSGELADAIPKLVELLTAYNSGELCR